jgi:hypothetical protein
METTRKPENIKASGTMDLGLERDNPRFKPEVKQEVKQEVRVVSDERVLTSQTEDKYDLNIILDYDGKVDVTYLEKKDPAYAYHYLNTRPENLARKTSNLLFQGGGWQLVPREHCLKLGIKPEQLAVDGTYRIGVDLVLARMPKGLNDKLKAYKDKEAQRPIKAVNRMIDKGSNDLKGYGHESTRGIETASQLGMKT